MIIFDLSFRAGLKRETINREWLLRTRRPGWRSQRHRHEFADQFAGFGIVQPNHAGEARRGDQLPVRSKRHRVHRAGFALQLGKQFAIAHLQDAHLARAVLAAAADDATTILVEAAQKIRPGIAAGLKARIRLESSPILRACVRYILYNFGTPSAPPMTSSSLGFLSTRDEAALEPPA